MGQRRVSRGNRENPRERPEGERAANERVPMHEQKSKMGIVWVDPDAAACYSPRWVNEVDQFGPRLPRFYLAGWQDVPPEAVRHCGAEAATHTEGGGSFLRKQVGLDRHGVPVFSRLLWIRNEWYQEDQDTKQAKIDATEGQIKRTLQEGEGEYYGDVGVATRLHKGRRKI